MKLKKTEKCIICGKKAVVWHGHVLGCYRAALGNYVDEPVIAGFCEEHKNKDYKSDENGCLGKYDSSKMGKCLPFHTDVMRTIADDKGKN